MTEAHGTAAAYEYTVRVEEVPVLAGGPMVAVWTLHGPPADVALGGSRTLNRTTGFSFAGTAEGLDVPLTDPAADVVDLGGPMGARPLPEAGLTVSLLVNQYLTVENLRPALPPGGSGVLALRCRWDLVAGAEPVPLELTLRVPVRRDDDALADVVREQVEAVLRTEKPDEDALNRLAALRYPDAARLVSAADADPERTAWALAALPDPS
jgi:hypothetical protein